MDKSIKYIIAILLAITGSVLAFMIVQHGIKIQDGDWIAGGVFTLLASYIGSGCTLSFGKIIDAILY